MTATPCPSWCTADHQLDTAHHHTVASLYRDGGHLVITATLTHDQQPLVVMTGYSDRDPSHTVELTPAEAAETGTVFMASLRDSEAGRWLIAAADLLEEA